MLKLCLDFVNNSIHTRRLVITSIFPNYKCRVLALERGDRVEIAHAVSVLIYYRFFIFLCVCQFFDHLVSVLLPWTGSKLCEARSSYLSM